MPDSSLVQLTPYDEFNQQLEGNVHPRKWVNPTADKPYHLVVIGAGTAGLVTAAGAAGLGARVALVERELMGGDCLNVGCVPSKALIRAARVAATLKSAERFGGPKLENANPDFAKLMERMRRLRAKISPADSAHRFRDLGVDVYLGSAAFSGRQAIEVRKDDGTTSKLEFRKAVIASGARASAPPVQGLEDVDYLTNENLFSLTELPQSMAVVGSGPIGCEMAQSFARFGCEVTLFERGDRIMPREDEDASRVVREEFERDGMNVVLNAMDMMVSPDADSRVRVQVTQDRKKIEGVFDKLLIAVGRAPNVEHLSLESAGVQYDRSGVQVDDFLRTTNPKVFAAGDVCSRFKFTHAADFMARIVIQNALFALGPIGRRKASDLLIPWATYTSPEVAHVGAYEHETRTNGIEIDTYHIEFADVDRAILEGQDQGFVKIHTRKGTDKIVGATIVAENAGDMISEITVAMKNGVGLSQIASTIHPYPTQAEAIRKLGDQYNRTKLTPLSKKVLDLLRKINVGS